MRLFLTLTPLLLLAASAVGCGSRSGAKPNPPPDVIENPNRPDPGAIQRRKRVLIDPPAGVPRARSEGKP
jgi:hypothetical protein